MRRRVILRADAGKHTGFGHFFRSLALAGHLKEEYDCMFASYNADDSLGIPTGHQLEEIYKIGDPMEVWGRTMDEYDEFFLDEIRSSDIVVLDNYYHTTEYQKRIKDKGCRLVCIDDVHNRHMVCDLLITGCPLCRGDFSLEPYTKFVGGIEWTFLRNPFLRPMACRNVPSRLGKVVMSMGGADAYDLTGKMIRVVRSVLPHVSIDVMAGETVQLSDEDMALANIHRNIPAKKVVELFDNADLGIFPASTVSVEALSRRLPVVAGHYADNQEELYAYGVSRHYFAPLGNLFDSQEEIENRLRDVLSYHRPMPAVIDFRGQGKKILKLFKELTVE